MRQNIVLFQRALEAETNESARVTLRALLEAARRELSALQATANGVELGQPFAPLRVPLQKRGHLEQLLGMLVAEAGPCMLLDPGPGLHIIGINEAFAKATMTAPADLRGQCLFDVFPDNPDDPLADGAANLYSSLTIAARHAKPHAMGIQRYDIRDRHGNFTERYWRPINTPLFDDNGVVIALMHRVDDVTLEVRARMAETIGAKPSLRSQTISSPTTSPPDLPLD